MTRDGLTDAEYEEEVRAAAVCGGGPNAKTYRRFAPSPWDAADLARKRAKENALTEGDHYAPLPGGGDKRRASAEGLMARAAESSVAADTAAPSVSAYRCVADINADRATKGLPPAPGSAAALDQGCRCAVLDNHHGAGIQDGWGGTPEEPVYWVNGGCPMHGGGVAA